MTYRETDNYKEALENLKNYGWRMEIDAMENRKKSYLSIPLTIVFVALLAICFKEIRDVMILAPATIGPLIGLKRSIAKFDEQIEMGRELQNEERLKGMDKQEVITKWNLIVQELENKK